MADILLWPTDLGKTVPRMPEWVDNLSLAATTSESWTVPAKVTKILGSSTAAVYVRVGAAAAVPASDVTDGTASFGLGTSFTLTVVPAQVLHFVCAQAAQVQLACYKEGV
ncbi:MAG TPA: hypothetical protein DEH78_19070 [Solibacterales bacterium]|nr:hypothetical protein [Bryobacterales bacterium]